jgi:hypothetical protein
MSELSGKTICVCDNGMFLPLALKLAPHFSRAFFWSPWEKAFPVVYDDICGEGFDEIIRVESPFEYLSEIDLFVFPDVGFADLQLHLESIGKRVWGSRKGSELELRRAFFKKVQAQVEMEVPPYKAVRGMTALKEYLADHPDTYVKMSRYRGMGETFHHLNMEVSGPVLDKLALKFGPLKEEVPFVVEDTIETDIEVGWDSWNIDGQWPSIGVQGFETKDRSLIGSVQKYEDAPEEVASINEALSAMLKPYRYRNFFSSEIRIKDEKSFLIDPTCRAPTPCIEGQMEIWGNLAEVIWHGAKGEVIEPEPLAPFFVECIIDHKQDEEQWRVLQVPKEAEQWVKLYSACKHGDLYCLPPLPHSSDAVGAVVGIGQTIEKAIEHLKKTVELLKDQPVTVHTDALYDTLVEIQKAEQQGIEFTDKEVPEPEVALK